MPRLLDKLKELDRVDEQMRRGVVTAREAVDQRVRVLGDANAILKAMLFYELGVGPDGE
jgi:hypothetical protein